MTHVTVQSRTLVSASYSSDRSLLELHFRDGAVHRFFGVPATCFDQLLASSSKGAYFNRNIRNRFRSQRVSGPGLSQHREN